MHHKATRPSAQILFTITQFTKQYQYSVSSVLISLALPIRCRGASTNSSHVRRSALFIEVASDGELVDFLGERAYGKGPDTRQAMPGNQEEAHSKQESNVATWEQPGLASGHRPGGRPATEPEYNVRPGGSNPRCSRQRARTLTFPRFPTSPGAL